jgi:hypothetical protein
MQRMWQAIQRTDRNSDVKTKNTRKYRVLCAENEDRGDGNQSKWESARKIAHQHHEMGGKTGEPVTVMESRCASRRDVTIEGDEIYTHIGENLPTQRIKRVDSDIYRT